jgi:hypothetical protein
VAEWSKAHAWKVCIRQKRIEGSNPSCSAIIHLNSTFWLIMATEFPFRLPNRGIGRIRASHSPVGADDGASTGGSAPFAPDLSLKAPNTKSASSILSQAV